MNRNMNKNKEVNYRKTVKHNVRDPIPNAVIIHEPQRPQSKPEETKENKKMIENIRKKTARTVSLSTPKLNTVLQVANKIKEVEDMKHRRIKSLSDMPKTERTTIDEKIARQVNFPFDKQLYKQLISLRLTERPAEPTARSTSYEPARKDQEPLLSDFFEPIPNQEYRIPERYRLWPDGAVRHFDGLSVHRTAQTWAE